MYLKKIITALVLALLFSSPALAMAQAAAGDASTAPGAGGIIGQRLFNVIGTNTYNPGTNESSMTQFIGLVVSVILSLFGVIFVVIIILAGFNYMMARGDKGKVEKALATIQMAIIGLLIVIAVYAIWQFLFFRLIVSR